MLKHSVQYDAKFLDLQDAMGYGIFGECYNVCVDAFATDAQNGFTLLKIFATDETDYTDFPRMLLKAIVEVICH